MMDNSSFNLRDELADIKQNYGSGRDLILAALEKAYQCVVEVKADVKLFDELCSLYKDAGIKKQKTTDAATMVTRLTIVGDAKKASPYATVFRKAYEENVDPDDFVAWIDAHGGIERIRLSNHAISKKLTDEEVQTIRQAGLKHLASQTVATEIQFADDIEIESDVALLAVHRASNDNAFGLVEVLDEQSSLTKTYLTSLGRKTSKAATG